MTQENKRLKMIDGEKLLEWLENSSYEQYDEWLDNTQYVVSYNDIKLYIQSLTDTNVESKPITNPSTVAENAEISKLQIDRAIMNDIIIGNQDEIEELKKQLADRNAEIELLKTLWRTDLENAPIDQKILVRSKENMDIRFLILDTLPKETRLKHFEAWMPIPEFKPDNKEK